MLDIDKFTNGIAILEKCYKGFNLNTEETSAWYGIIKSEIDEDAFLPLVFNYCKSESAPTCPADLIRFGKKVMTDSAPTPTLVAYALINAPRRMLLSEFMYDDPSVDEQKEYLLNDITVHYPGFRNPPLYTVVVALTNEYFEVLIDTVGRNDATEVSILKSELKSSYRKELDKTISHTILTANAIEGMHPLLLR